jgi:hypothetical protein
LRDESLFDAPVLASNPASPKFEFPIRSIQFSHPPKRFFQFDHHENPKVPYRVYGRTFAAHLAATEFITNLS